jgi:hypothetical protein
MREHDPGLDRLDHPGRLDHAAQHEGRPPASGTGLSILLLWWS